jgi:hypothetical protein
MSTELATAEELVAVATINNPFDVPSEIARIDTAVNAYVDSLVTGAEGDIKYLTRRRRITYAVRRSLVIRTELEDVLRDQDLYGPVLTASRIATLRTEMVTQFNEVNPTAEPTVIASAVDRIVAPFLERVVVDEQKKTTKRGKSYAG